MCAYIALPTFKTERGGGERGNGREEHYEVFRDAELSIEINKKVLEDAKKKRERFPFLSIWEMQFFFLFGPKLCREWYDTEKSASISLAWEKGKKLLQCTFRDKLFLLFAGIREGVQLAHFILRLPPKKSHFPSFFGAFKVHTSAVL